MGRRRPLLTRLDRLAVAAIASPWLIGLAAFGIHDLAELLPRPDPAHQDKAAIFHAWMELLSFAGTFGLFASALIAGWITFSQVRDARATRVAAIYMEVNKTYTSEPMRQSRMEILKVKREFEASLERFQRDWNKKAVLENALAFVLSSNFITGPTPLMVILL